MVRAIKEGNVEESFSHQNHGKMMYIRWLTTANRIL